MSSFLCNCHPLRSAQQRYRALHPGGSELSVPRRNGEGGIETMPITRALWVVFLSFSVVAQQVGIQAGDIDRAADPCVDFYQYANGAWRAANPIPPFMTRWSRVHATGAATKGRL